MPAYLGSQRMNAYGPEWVRPSDWLPMPTPNTQEALGLIAVYPTDSNYVAVSANGDYYVDWGDGTSGSYVNNATAEYSHSYDSLPSESYCSRGYRQAWVRITPSGSGQNLTKIVYQKKHSRAGLPTVPTVPWLDIYLTGSSLGTASIGGTVILNSLLERCQFYTGKLSNPNTLFQSCYKLQSVVMPDTSTAANFDYVFNSCFSIKTIPWFDTGKGTSFNNSFYFCQSIKSMPLLNLQSGSNLGAMFTSCYALNTVPQFNTQNATVVGSMFQTCYSLTSVPLLNTSKVTSFNSMFTQCTSLKEIPPLNTQSGSTFNSMCASNSSLRNVPLLDTSNATSFQQMYNSCYSLLSIPAYNASSVTNFNTMLGGDKGLRNATLSGSTRTIDYSTLNLSRDAIVNIFNNLGLAALTQSISCSANYGAADLTAADIQIATDKGWLVKTA